MTDKISQCPVYKKCNGCQLQNMEYSKQLKWKECYIKKLFGKYCKVEPIIGMEYPLYYRNKVQAVYRKTKDNKLVFGIYQSGRKGIVSYDKCMTQDQLASKIVITIRQLMEKYRIQPYNSQTKSGLIKHVLIRCGKQSHEYMVVIAVDNFDFPNEEKFLKRLLSAHPQIKTVVLNENKQDILILSDNQKVIYGDGYISDTLCGYRFNISPQSFYQINSEQTEKLYSLTIEMAELTTDDVVLDAYCGIGTIGICASSHCKEVIAVESNKRAIDDAVINAKINNINNIQFTAEDAGEYITKLAKDNIRIDTALIDPPRAGCSRQFLQQLATLKPERIVYISCNPETQLRDCKFLFHNGYNIERCRPVDMFPFSRHSESVVKLTRR